MVLKTDFVRGMENAQDPLNENFEQLNNMFGENLPVRSIDSNVTVDSSSVSKIIKIGEDFYISLNLRLMVSKSYGGGYCIQLDGTLPAGIGSTVIPCAVSYNTSLPSLRCIIEKDGRGRVYGTSTTADGAVYITGLYPLEKA